MNNRTNALPDFLFKGITLIFALLIPVVFLLILIMLVNEAIPGFKSFGWQFLANSKWDPVADIYGAWPFIYGTLVSSFLALIIAVPVGLGCALYLSEISRNPWSNILGTLVDLLAAIPSVVYGLWGIFILGPFISEVVQPFLQQWLGFLPIFQGGFHGLSMLTAGFILAIMILPTITSISREVFHVVPKSLRESALAIGGNRFDTIKLAVLPVALSGVVGAIILGLGRAVGETMAVTMVIGNRPDVSVSLFSPGYTLSSVIANEFAEAVTDLNYSVLFEMALILLALTVIINGLARLLIWNITRQKVKA